MLPLLQFGPLSLPIPPLLLIVGFWLGSVLAEKMAPRFEIDPKFLERVIWVGLASGLIGARLSFLVRFPAAFKGEWLSLLSLNPSFLDPAGGILVGLSAMLFLVLKDNGEIFAIADTLSVFAGTIMVFFFLSRFASGTAPGTAADIPWGISLWNEIRHPVQIYYAVAGSLGLAAVFQSFFTLSFPAGGLSAALLSYTAGYLLLLSKFQEPRLELLFGYRSDQILYWSLLLTGLLLYQYASSLKEKGGADAPSR